MQIQHLTAHAAIAIVAAGTMISSFMCSHAQLKEMRVEFEESMDTFNEKENQMLQRIDNLQTEIENLQQEQKKTKREFNLLIAKKQENISYSEETEVTENNNRINSIVIAKQKDGQYLLNFYKVGVQLYDYMMTTDIPSTLTSIDSSYTDDIETVFLDGCKDKRVLDTLRYFKNLKHLNLDDCTFSDVSRISKLNELEYLRISDCPNVSDISSFKTLSNLSVLILNNTEVENIESLSYLSALEVADLRGNKILNPCCLANSPKLYRLVLTDNCITNRYYLSELVNNNIISEQDVKEIIVPSASTKTINGTL